MDSDEDILRPQKVFFLDTNLDSPVLTTEFAQTKNFLLDYYKWRTAKKSLFKFDPKRRAALVEFSGVCKKNGWKATDLSKLDPLSPKEYPLCEELMLKSSKGCSYYEAAVPICNELEDALMTGMEKRGLSSSEVRGTMAGFTDGKYTDYEHAYEMFGDYFGRASSRVRNAEYRWTKGEIGEL